MKKLLTCFLPCLLAALPARAQLSGYTQSAVLTISHTQVANTDQLTFPVLISAQANTLKGAAWGGQMQSASAYDIAFSSDAAGNNLLPYERVRHDLILGRVVYWVQVPTLSHTSDTAIYIWFGNSSITSDQSNPTAVWDSNYKGVWHLAENAANTIVNDSTANGHQGSNAASTNTRLALGKIANLTSLNYSSQVGTGDYTSVPSGSGGDFDFTSTNFTFEFWLSLGALPAAGEEAVFGNGGSNSNGGHGAFGYLLYVASGARKLTFVDYAPPFLPASTLTTRGAVGVGTWTHVAIIRNGSSLSIYLNGSLDSSISNYVGASSSAGPLALGAGIGYSNTAACMALNGCFAGSLEEFRASNTSRSSDWITTSYNNQNSVATFFSQVPAGWDFSSTSTPPACSAGTPQSFRAGYPAVLDGSGSYSLAGLPLAYLWQQVGSTAAGIPLQRLHWSSRTAAKPTITGLVFGPANFQLTVTQSDGASSTCSVNHGAVATDDNGTVMEASTNPALDSAISTLLGPMVQLGRNPWPFYDQAAVADAAVQIAGMDTFYPDYWDIPAQGTISVTPGSQTVIGNGTNFLSTFCNTAGAVNPTYPAIAMVVWYPLNDPNYPAGTTGRRVIPNSGPYIASCQSDMQLTLNQPWSGDVSACPTGQSPPCWLQYSLAFGPPPSSAANAWQANTAPADFYDAVAAYYALYYRSGQDFYLINARKWADRFWTAPENDRGNSYQYYGAFSWTPMFRNWSMMGMVLRALDTADGHPDMWPGLHKVWTKTMGGYWLGYYPNAANVSTFDAREYAYGLLQLSYCALYDESAAEQQTCRTAITSTFATSGTGYLNIWPQQVDPVTGGFLSLLVNGSGLKDSWGSHTSVNLRNGSTAVSCNGSCGWSASDSQFSVQQGIGAYPIWFTFNPSQTPTGSAAGDPDAYCFQTATVTSCTFIDSNHFTLDRPYNEPGCDNGCVKGWAYGVGGDVGWTMEPFFSGILGFAFHIAGQAMACTSPGVPVNCDAPTSAAAYQYNTQSIQWMMNYGYRSSTYGMYYFVGSPVCPFSGIGSTNDVNGWCTGGNAIQSREYAADGLRGMMVYYQRTGDPAAKTMIDNIYAGLWGKPSTNPIVPSPDGTYDNSFDSGGTWLNTNSTANKLFGQMFGFGRGDNWPAIRLGGLLPAHNLTLFVTGRIGDISNATSMRVTITEPSGVVDPPVVCSSSPCAVTFNQGAGNPTVQVDYLSASGAVLHGGQPFVATVN